MLDSKKVKADDLIKVGTNHRYRKCVFGKFKEDVLNALVDLLVKDYFQERKSILRQEYHQGH